MGGLEDDIQQMVQVNKTISLEEVQDAIYTKLRKNIAELSIFNQIIKDMTLELADESQ